MMLTLDQLRTGFETFGLKDKPVIAHASLKSFGYVQGGAEALIVALLDSVGALVMTAHTYKTMVTPLAGPKNNGMAYGEEQDLNRMAEFFTPDMPVDPLMGAVPEILRHRRDAQRSMHPILSFVGVNAEQALASQTLDEPLAPIRALAEQGGWILLLGVDHTVSTSIHYAEKLAGRRQFLRWALTEEGVIPCPGFPGCSMGFRALESEAALFAMKANVGEALVQAVPMVHLFNLVVKKIKENPHALLCQQDDCARCNAIRNG
jgi:aminoglycoside 3-N-acetyltransferase